MKDRYAGRMERLRQAMSEQGVESFLVLSPANRFYLSGFELFDPQCNESSGCLLITRGRTFLMTDPRYLEAARERFADDEIFIYSHNKLEKINDFLKKLGISRLWFEPQWMNHDFFASLKKEFEPVPVRGLVEDLRLIKDQGEIKAMRNSCSLNHQVFSLLEKTLEPGLRETLIAWNAEKMFREKGASGLSFSSIVASGSRSALPHAIPRDVPVKDQSPLLIDMGCRLDDYCSDQTRTFWMGNSPAREFQTARDLVIKAQELAINSIEPGMPVKHAYELVREFFEKHGVFQHFNHALGHGIGLETHEPPSVGPQAKGNFLPGMVISIEPGLYYPEWGGFRWEYMVLVTENGTEIL